MNRADECTYNVIQFLEAPYKDIADYVCVPRSWVQSRGPDDRKVRVSYPDEKSSDTEKRVKKRKRKLDQWKSYLCVVKHRTDSYDEAKVYIQGMISEMRNADNTLSSAKVEATPRRCARFATRSAKMNIMDYLELSPTSNNHKKSTNTTTLKRKARLDPDKKDLIKRSRVTEPDESNDEVAEPSSQAFELTCEDQSLTPEFFDEDLCTQKLPVVKTNDRNNTENRPTVNPNPSEANHSLDSEIIVKQEFIDDLFRSVRELQTNLQVYTSSLFTETVNKFMNNVNMRSAWGYNGPITSSSKITTQEVPNLNDKKRNDERDADDVEDIQPLKKESCPKRIKKVVLPSEYDENDSRWTLRYRKPAPGLVELMPHTGVYVKALSLTNCKRLSRDCKTLARMLLTEIFTTSALSTCSWTGTRAKAFDREGTNVRPGLNEHARTVLLNYVAVRAEKEGWNNCENQTILNSMRNKMQEMRCKYES